MREKLNMILSSGDVATKINEELEFILLAIPEIKNIIGFDHKHPHHHLDVWQHTLCVISNLNTSDIELNMAALLHDIGKPFSFQEGEVRHFHGHPEVSYEMTKNILTRLGYDKPFVKRVSYLVLTHDSIIDTMSIASPREILCKRLELQYADAKAHHPDKVKKRIRILDDIKSKLLF